MPLAALVILVTGAPASGGWSVADLPSFDAWPELRDDAPPAPLDVGIGVDRWPTEGGCPPSAKLMVFMRWDPRRPPERVVLAAERDPIRRDVPQCGGREDRPVYSHILVNATTVFDHTGGARSVASATASFWAHAPPGATISNSFRYALLRGPAVIHESPVTYCKGGYWWCQTWTLIEMPTGVIEVYDERPPVDGCDKRGDCPRYSGGGGASAVG